MFEELPHYGLQDYLSRHESIVNPEIDGLLREVILDKANGFVGRTVIHPTHVKFVNFTRDVYRCHVRAIKKQLPHLATQELVGAPIY